MSSPLAGHPLGSLVSEGDSQVLETGANLALSLVPCRRLWSSGLRGLSFLPAVSPQFTSRWHCHAESWALDTARSFHFIPLPSQETFLAGLVQHEAVVPSGGPAPQYSFRYGGVSQPTLRQAVPARCTSPFGIATLDDALLVVWWGLRWSSCGY